MKPHSEEPPSYNPYELHILDQEGMMDALLRENRDVLMANLPNVIQPRCPSDSLIIPTIDGAKHVKRLVLKISLV